MTFSRPRVRTPYYRSIIAHRHYYMYANACNRAAHKFTKVQRRKRNRTRRSGNGGGGGLRRDDTTH